MKKLQKTQPLAFEVIVQLLYTILSQYFAHCVEAAREGWSTFMSPIVSLCL